MSIYQKFIFLFLVLGSATLSFGEPIDLITKKLSTSIDQSKPEAIKLLKDLVDINSQTEQVKGVRQVGMLLEAQLRTLGFDTYWEEMPTEMNRAGNLFGVKKGNKGKRLLLIGHLDTVFPGGKNSFQPLSNHWAQGVGVSDMKGGDVVIIEALKALNRFNLLDDTTIRVAFIGDEENAGYPINTARAELKKLAQESDVVLDFESGPPSLGRRGVTSWELLTVGIQQHSSLIFQPDVGSGAIFELARILNAFAKELSHVENLTINSGIVLGGSEIDYRSPQKKVEGSGKFNVIAKMAYAGGDLRYISLEQKNDTQSKMKQIVDNHFPHTKANITFTQVIPPMTPNQAGEKLLSQYNEIRVLLKKPVLEPLPPKLRGGGDISYVADIIPAGLVGLGPLGKDEHSTNEEVDLDSLHDASKQAAILIYRLTHHYPNLNLDFQNKP
ncbi:MAG: M20/M25/M40 family metallo-hydrolase [Gammaproteobacteria bacterium]|nr:M20/M25/M40 family metallo-hydrolase [Gammaproteobacteria bacterium]